MFHILASSSTTKVVRSTPPLSASPPHAELFSAIGLPPVGDFTAQVPFASAQHGTHQGMQARQRRAVAPAGGRCQAFDRVPIKRPAALFMAHMQGPG